MTWLGKILAVLVMLMALVWMWFTAAVFAARTNWKVQAEAYKKAYDEAKAARESEYRMYQAEKDALSRQLTSAQEEAKTQAGLVATAEKASKEFIQKNAELDKILKESDLKAVGIQANYQASLEELAKNRERLTVLENERVKLVIAREQAEKERQASENLAKQAQADKLQADRRVEELTTQVNELRSSGGSSTATVLNSLNKAPAPTPEGLRGTVERFEKSSGLVQVSVGIDSGVVVGSVLDVYRAKDGEDARYLGTVVISSSTPKRAVGVFRPADPRKTIQQLRAEELPQSKDTVGRIGAIGTSR